MDTRTLKRHVWLGLFLPSGGSAARALTASHVQHQQRLIVTLPRTTQQEKLRRAQPLPFLKSGL